MLKPSSPMMRTQGQSPFTRARPQQGFPFSWQVLIRDALCPGPLLHIGPHYHQSVPQSTNLGDILANAITHGIGLGFAVVGAVYLIAASARGPALVIV
jgi:hypothetical protein